MSDKTFCYGCLSDIGIGDVCPYCGFDPGAYLAPFNALDLGTVLDERYIIGKVLGSGGFGITYLAFDKRLDIAVAIKEYLPKSLASREATTQTIQPHSVETKNQFEHHMDKFMEEARAIAKFNHEPGIVSVQDVIELNNTVYIIMHYVNGITLEDFVSKHEGRLSFDKTMKIMSTVMHSLAKVHHENLIHRDISPDNIYITHDYQVKLLDFGAARYVVTEESQSLSIILKPGFAPIEQYSTKGKQGPWTDVYAVSATIYWMLSGIKPQNSMDRMLEDEVTGLSDMGIDISPYISAVIMKGLEVDYKARIQSMDELVMLLEDRNETILIVGETDDLVNDSFNKKVRVEKQEKAIWFNYKAWIPFTAVAIILVLLFTMGPLGGAAQDGTSGEEVVINDGDGDALKAEEVSNGLKEILDTSEEMSVEMEENTVHFVPDVTGYAMKEAVELLESLGAIIDLIEVESSVENSGIIVETNEVGKEINDSLKVEIYVGIGPRVEVVFEDSGFEALIRDTHQLDGVIYEDDLAKIISIHFQEGYVVNSLDDLRYFTNMERLTTDFGGTVNGDVTAFSTLRKLKELAFHDCVITGDIRALTGLGNLEILSIQSPYLTGDIESLSGLSKLETLDLMHCKVEGNLSKLSELVMLRELCLNDTLVSGDISKVSELTFLTSFCMTGLNITGDIGSLGKHPYLENIDLWDSRRISGNIGDLKDLQDLKQLRVTNTSVYGDLGSLSGISLDFVESVDTEVTGEIELSNGVITDGRITKNDFYNYD